MAVQNQKTDLTWLVQAGVLALLVYLFTEVRDLRVEVTAIKTAVERSDDTSQTLGGPKGIVEWFSESQVNHELLKRHLENHP